MLYSGKSVLKREAESEKRIKETFLDKEKIFNILYKKFKDIAINNLLSESILCIF